jgi:chromosome segregation ATPase
MDTSQFSSINSDDEIDVQELCNDYRVVFKAYNKVSSKLKDVLYDKESVDNELSESHVLIDSLKSEKETLANDLSKSHILIDSLKSEISVLFEKSLSLENKLNVSKELSRNSSSDNLKSFLCIEESVLTSLV